jgi:hypothetical protein
VQQRATQRARNLPPNKLSHTTSKIDHLSILSRYTKPCELSSIITEASVDLNLQKEQFSYAYLYAIASAAGYAFQLTPRPLDFDSIDAIISGRGIHATYRYPRLELQVKSTTRPLANEKTIKYPLSIKNYNDLRMGNSHSPRILVVVTIPEEPARWTSQTTEELCLRNGAYWISLHNAPISKNLSSVTLSIPNQNIFNVDALQQIMQRIEADKPLC